MFSTSLRHAGVVGASVLSTMLPTLGPAESNAGESLGVVSAGCPLRRATEEAATGSTAC